MIVSFVDKDFVQNISAPASMCKHIKLKLPTKIRYITLCSVSSLVWHCTLYCLALHFVTFHKKGCRKGPCNDIILGIWILYRLLVTHNDYPSTPSKFFFVILLVGIIDQRRQFLVASGWPNQCKNSGPPKKEKSEIPWGFWWVFGQGNYQASGYWTPCPSPETFGVGWLKP